MAEKCWCESAKDDIDKAYKNPNPYHGVLQDVMDAEIDYAKMCSICPCRKRRLERGEEPTKKRKEDEESDSDASLLVTEVDSDEEREEEDRNVEEELDEEAEQECAADTKSKRKSTGACDEQRPRLCVCIDARDRVVEALIPPNAPLAPFEREELMLEFATARTWCEYCTPAIEGKDVCSCYEARKRAAEMKGPQAEPTFPSLFEIRAAEVEEELAIARCQYCNSEEYDEVNTHLPPLNLMKWTRNARLFPELVFVDDTPLSPPCARIASAPPLMRPRVDERVGEVE